MSVRSRAAWGLFATFAVLGFLLATQARVQESRARDLELQSVEELTTLVGTLTRENDRLQDEITTLRIDLLRDRLAGEGSEEELVQQQRVLGELQRVSGVVAGFGPGVRLRIEDPLHRLGAYELFQLMNELKSAGAEAITLNGERLDYRSSFTQQGTTLSQEGNPLLEPYVVHAVGDREGLFSSLVMAGGVIPSFESLPGVAIDIEKLTRVEVRADETLPDFVHASPAAD